MKLTIKNIHKLEGKLAHPKWEIAHILERDNDYFISLVNSGQYKTLNWSLIIERMKYGDGYRMVIKDKMNNDVDCYVRSENIAHITDMQILTEHLINKAG